MKPLKIPCLFHDEQTAQMTDLGITPTIEEYEKRPVYFYKIDSIYKGFENSKTGEKVEVTLIWSGGTNYTTKIKINNVFELIENWNEQIRN